MHGVRLLIGYTWLISVVVMLGSWLVYLPWFRRLLARRDPSEFERTGAWTFVPTSDCLTVALYFLRREYRASSDPAIRAHGAALRWTYSFTMMLAAFTLLLGLGVERTLGW